MAEAIERKYALIKGLGAGDWLLPGNNGKTLWRLSKEDNADAIGDWSLWSWQKQIGSYIDPEDLEDWSQWDLQATGHKTREDAMREALKREQPRSQTPRRVDPRPAGQVLAEAFAKT